MISNEFFYETNITINDKILFDIYSNNKNLFIDTNATFSNDKRYHSAVVYLDSNESKPI